VIALVEFEETMAPVDAWDVVALAAAWLQRADV